MLGQLVMYQKITETIPLLDIEIKFRIDVTERPETGAGVSFTKVYNKEIVIIRTNERRQFI